MVFATVHAHWSDLKKCIDAENWILSQAWQIPLVPIVYMYSCKAITESKVGQPMRLSCLELYECHCDDEYLFLSAL